MFYTVYKITNKLDGKFYIGKHQTKKLDDGYMGSGKLLKRAIEKHGRDNFIKEILHVFETEREMNEKEKELVVLSEETYNLCEGGLGGFGYLNTSGRAYRNYDIGKESKKGRDKIKVLLSDPEYREKWSERCSRNSKGRKTFLGKHHTEESKQKSRDAMKGRVPWNKGIPRTAEEKEKIRQGVVKKFIPNNRSR